MFEIEAKVRLTEADFKRLSLEIPKFAKRVKQVTNKDSYYEIGMKDYSIRIREQNGAGILNFKSKKRGEGIEMNQEIEIPLKSASDFSLFLNKSGIRQTAKKEKIGNIYKYGDTQIELNTIKKLGHFLEIETLVGRKSEIPSAKKALRDLFCKLGFSPLDFEKKYYLELLEE